MHKIHKCHKTNEKWRDDLTYCVESSIYECGLLAEEREEIMELELIKFIKEHENWEELLLNEPYNLKISRDEGYIMFKYNQLSSDFSNEIVRECRGIILRECDFKPVCVPFFKFGNYGESYCPEINWASASVQQKVDGSLMKVWYDDGEWHVSTNGKINVFKAELASIHFASFGDLFIDALSGFGAADTFEKFTNMLEEDYTYMFELVSPENRVVIPYETTELFYLGCRNNKTLLEESPRGTYLAQVFYTPKVYRLYSLAAVQNAASALPWDEEGYVVCDSDFNRVKIKSPEYVKAHYSRNNSVISYERLLEVILSGEKAEFLIYASDFKEDLNKVEASYNNIIAEVKKEIAELNTESFASRKEYAMKVLEKPGWMQGFLFKYDKLDEYIAAVRPSKWIEFMEAKCDITK